MALLGFDATSWVDISINPSRCRRFFVFGTLPWCSLKCYVARRSVWNYHDDVVKWKHYPRYWPFGRGIHWSPMDSTHKGQWRGALMFLWSAPKGNGWANNRDTDDLDSNRLHYNVNPMMIERHSWLHKHQPKTFGMQDICNLVLFCLESTIYVHYATTLYSMSVQFWVNYASKNWYITNWGISIHREWYTFGRNNTYLNDGSW